MRTRARTNVRTMRLAPATPDSQHVQSASLTMWTSGAASAQGMARSPLRRARFPHGHTHTAGREEQKVLRGPVVAPRTPGPYYPGRQRRPLRKNVEATAHGPLTSGQRTAPAPQPPTVRQRVEVSATLIVVTAPKAPRSEPDGRRTGVEHVLPLALAHWHTLTEELRPVIAEMPHACVPVINLALDRELAPHIINHKWTIQYNISLV